VYIVQSSDLQAVTAITEVHGEDHRHYHRFVPHYRWLPVKFACLSIRGLIGVAGDINFDSPSRSHLRSLPFMVNALAMVIHLPRFDKSHPAPPSVYQDQLDLTRL
jgi:hypothetical protein